MNSITLKNFFFNQDSFVDKFIELRGWVKTLRNYKNVSFIELNDGSCFKSIQIVVDSATSNFDEVTKIPVGTSIIVNGRVIKSLGSEQTLELQANNIDVICYAEDSYPIQKKRHTLEYLRTIAHLRPRTNTFSAVFRIRSIASFAIHEFFQKNNFIYVNTPIITTSDCEGAGDMFRVSSTGNTNNNLDNKKEFFGKPAYLTVSGQLGAEAFALAMRNVYTFGPTFRAENSNTARHAAEFWMIEPEMAFANLYDCMSVAENMLKYCIKYVIDNAIDEISFCDKFLDNNLISRLNKLINSKFECITYTEAINLLQKASCKFVYPVSWGLDLQTEHEKYLTEHIFDGPVFVIDYPKDIKAFYMRLNNDSQTVAAMDLLVPSVGEIIGGSQREERMEFLLKRLKELNLDPDAYWWYLDLRRFGSVMHSGYGLGFERLIMYLTGVSNIRDVIPFARTVNNAEF